MPKFTAHFETTASASLTMDVPNDVAADGPEAIAEYIYANHPDAMPSVCAQCSGWGKAFSLDLGDFETTVHEDGEHKGTAYVTDAARKPVTD